MRGERGVVSAVALPPFQTLIDMHSEVVMRFLVRRAGSQDAEDCFQETFLAALRAYPGLRETSNLRGWLLTIARNKVADRQRAVMRHPTVALDDVEVAAPQTDADAGGVWEAVRTLPPKQRAAVTQRYADDRSYADIARVMATSSDAARRNVHEGIKNLRRKRDDF